MWTMVAKPHLTVIELIDVGIVTRHIYEEDIFVTLFTWWVTFRINVLHVQLRGTFCFHLKSADSA